jgi:signal transduction histidine kinase
MSAPLRTHLLFNYLAILLLGMGLAGVLSWHLVENLYIETQRENLIAQAELIASALQGQALIELPAEPYSQAANVQPGIHARLLGEQGAVIVGLSELQGSIPLQVPVAESTSPVTPAELLERPEIGQALQGEPASAIRQVASEGNRRVLYAAAPAYGVDGSVTALVYLAMPLPAGGLPTEMVLQLGAVFFIAVLLAVLAGMLLTRRILTPLENISQAAAAVSKGDLHQQLEEKHDIDELNALGRAFNHMTESLLQSDQAKRAFVADVAHELRTPLTVIKGTIETLEDGAMDDLAGRGSLLAAMQHETERLIRMVNDLLVLTRAEAEMLELDIQLLDLSVLASQRCQQLAPMAARQNVQLDVIVVDPDGSTRTLADADRVAQVLDNLLDNAMRYSPSGTTVTVTLSQEGAEVHCGVHDCGAGIPTQHLPFIFDRFYRADVSRQRSTGGAGLGLAIARALILAQGGHIRAESIPGEGATIIFSLPASIDCHATA